MSERLTFSIFSHIISEMKYFDWDEEKNQKLKEERAVSFEEVVQAIENQKSSEPRRHSNQKKYPNQRIFYVEIRKYIYIVPFVEDERKIFFKTIIPSRKATKKYLIDRKEDK